MLFCCGYTKSSSWMEVPGLPIHVKVASVAGIETLQNEQRSGNVIIVYDFWLLT